MPSDQKLQNFKNNGYQEGHNKNLSQYWWNFALCIRWSWPWKRVEVDLGGGISDDELESDWEYESEPDATKQSETIPTNVVMTEQSTHPGLHPDLCFELYYTALDYSNHGQ